MEEFEEIEQGRKASSTAALYELYVSFTHTAKNSQYSRLRQDSQVKKT